MVKTSDFVEHAQRLIADSKKLKKVIESILEFLSGNKNYKDLRTTAILLSQSYLSNEQRYIEGTDDNHEQRTKLVKGIIGLLDSIEEECEADIPIEKLQKLHDLIDFPSKEVLTQIKPIESVDLPTPINQIDDKSDLEKLLVIKNQDFQKITLNSTKKEIREALEERKRFNEEHDAIFKEKLHFVNVQKGLVHYTFDSIYTADALTDSHIQDIQKIREDFDSFQWYDRAVIVSALTLSLIHCMNFDEKKANLLIDFLNDGEEKVWQRALVGLVLSLNYNPNRWLYKKQLRSKLETLRQHPKIQETCRIIDFILLYNIHKNLSIPSHIFEQPFFVETPLHCFLPFYENNEILVKNIESAKPDFDGGGFSEFLNEMPINDSLKYWSCLILNQTNNEKREVTEEHVMSFFYVMAVAHEFYPILNIIADFYNFYAYYPNNSHKDMFDKKLCISQTTLKELILSKTTRLLVDAEQALNKERNVKAAIISLEQVLKIDGVNEVALSMLIKCCINEGNLKEAIIYGKRLETIRPEDFENLHSIGDCYASQSKYKEALIYFEKVKILQPDYLENWLRILDVLNEQNNILELNHLITELETRFSDSYKLMKLCSKIYGSKDIDEKALHFAQKWNKLRPNNADCITDIAQYHSNMVQIEEAIKYIEIAYKLDNKDGDTLMTYGRILIIGRLDINKAEIFIKEALEIEKRDVFWGNLGHIELIKGNQKMALKYYSNCAQLFDKIDKLEKAFDLDWQFMKQYDNISEELYNNCKEEAIKHWHKTHKVKGGGLKKK